MDNGTLSSAACLPSGLWKVYVSTVPGANTLENSNKGYLAAALGTQFSPGAHVGDGNVDLC